MDTEVPALVEIAVIGVLELHQLAPENQRALAWELALVLLNTGANVNEVGTALTAH